MLHRFLVFYKQNRITIFTAIGIAILVLVVIHMLNNNIKENNEAKQTNNSYTYGTNRTENTKFSSGDSQVTGNKVSKTDIKNANKYISEFLENCFKNNTEEAYNMLTDNCKQAMFKDIDTFNNVYAQKLHEINDAKYDIANWVNSIYKVKIYENPLATGKYNEKSIQDYITLVKDEDGYKLNINNYIAQQQIKIKKEMQEEKLTFIVLKKDIFMEYEEYEIEIKNNNSYDLLLDTKKNSKSMYIEDTNGVQYNSYSHEIADSNLIVYKR